MSSALHWWTRTGEPDKVRAVLACAYLRDGVIDTVHDVAVLVYGPHAATVVALAADLEWIERLDVEPPREVLGDYFEHDRPGYSVADAEGVRDALRAAAVVKARLVAGVARIDGRAA